MQKLVEHQEDLIKADKNRKENRRGIQEICRMRGSLTQSYFIFDSHQYKVARKIYFGIEEDDIMLENRDDDAQVVAEIEAGVDEDGAVSKYSRSKSGTNRSKKRTKSEGKK